LEGMKGAPGQRVCVHSSKGRHGYTHPWVYTPMGIHTWVYTPTLIERAAWVYTPTLIQEAHLLLLWGWSEPYIYTLYIRYFWQGNHQIYGHILRVGQNRISTF